MEKCFFSADILLPKTDFNKWAVIACDQYTSEPEYWEEVKKTVGDCPSALNLILPEVYLSDDNTARINKINANMQKYLKDGILNEYKQSYIYIERTQNDGRVRKGIIGMIDLEAYDYSPDSKSEIRATEKTVISRIPPRVEIRKSAPLEIPHVMLLVDDDENILIGSIEKNKDNYKLLYDFKLMQSSGSIKAFLVNKEDNALIEKSIEKLSKKHNDLTFCVGDGNHSLATAKECYNQNKTELSRYSLVEVVNIHDTALDFEPIYRVLFGIEPEKVIADFKQYCKNLSGSKKEYRCIYGDKEQTFFVNSPELQSVATLQNFLDEYLKENKNVTLDYIHGIESLKKLCKKENSLGFIFKGIEKGDLFKSVCSDGSLPRKTFSMGHACDKRFYIEARRIK